MSLEDVKKQFIVDEGALKERLERVVAKALKHCQIDKNGHVLMMNSGLSGKDQVKLTLAARSLAAQLGAPISAEATVAEISKFTGLPANQVRARGKEAIKDKFAESPKPGVYRAILNKIEAYLDSITVIDKSGAEKSAENNSSMLSTHPRN